MTSLWKSGTYNKTNGGQFRDAMETIQRILNDNIGPMDIIVDIGCGSGNVTHELAKAIPHTKLYASDFDPKMVEFAKNNYGGGSIEYFVQDIGLPWDEMNPILKSLEGKVSLVWSNRVLHWVKDRATAINNIQRLVKPGGYCYINITPGMDVDTYAESCQEILKDLKNNFTIRGGNEEIDDWKSIFNNEFRKVDLRRVDKHWKYETTEQWEGMLESIEPFLNKMYKSNLPEEKRKIMFSKIVDFFRRGACSPNPKNVLEKLPENPVDLYYQQLNVVCQK